MNASFEEKSVWIQLVSMLVILGTYFVVAGRMLINGVTILPLYAPVFVVSVVLMVVVLVAGHIVAALTGRPDGRDERDRLIEWRAESNASWIVVVGVLAAIAGLVVSVADVWVAHALLFFLFVSEVVKYVLQLVYYRRGL